MNSLVLTLGHNSSAVLIVDGRIIAGYEEERLSGEKSDSKFPINAIIKLIQVYNVFMPKDINICVSHWFLDGGLPDEDNKYWNKTFLKKFFPRAIYYSLNTGTLTHHDAHAYSAQVFAGKGFSEDYYLAVMDGFGTEGECISIYRKELNGELEKIRVIHGFYKSLGLLYQYATDFCGMRMHQHEYKMLAYETHITEVLSTQDILALDQRIDFWAEIHSTGNGDIKETSLGNLEAAHFGMKLMLAAHLTRCEMDYNIDISDIRIARIIISYIVQGCVERIVLKLLRGYQPRNLIVVGGLFYNVKLNSLLCDMVPGKFCAMPLAGDQGAGLGVYQYYFKDLKWPEHLFWGTRDLRFIPTADGIIKSFNHTLDQLRACLFNDGIVNLVRGSMEFGPRTLCNTSTLALPTSENAELINKMNGRTNEMPFALVVTQEQATELFEDIDKVHKSLEYMIVTRKFKPFKHIGLEGGAHFYPLEKVYTCRPQITSDPLMVALLNEFGPLINTSFNYHGQPIVYDQKSIEWAQCNERKYYNINTIVEEL